MFVQATNNTDYQLLESKNVSIFVDSNFVAKTSMNSVSPGESFQTCLGYDPAIKVWHRCGTYINIMSSSRSRA